MPQLSPLYWAVSGLAVLFVIVIVVFISTWWEAEMMSTNMKNCNNIFVKW